MAVIRLYHGTDVASANDILLNGLDAAKAAGYNAVGEFWATEDVSVASWFAQTNPSGGQATILEFQLEEGELQRLLAIRPKVVVRHGSHEYEFMPICLPLLNKVLLRVNVT